MQECCRRSFLCSATPSFCGTFEIWIRGSGPLQLQNPQSRATSNLFERLDTWALSELLSTCHVLSQTDQQTHNRDEMTFFRPDVSVHELHHNAATQLATGINQIFQMNITQEALAQIIDNMPTRGHYYGCHAANRQPHPDIESRTKPSAQALSLARELATTLDSLNVKVDAEVKDFSLSLTHSELDRADLIRASLSVPGGVAKLGQRACFGTPILGSTEQRCPRHLQ